MDREFEYAAHPRSARIRALIHLAKVTRAEVVEALAEVERRIEQAGAEIAGEAGSQRFFGMALIDLGAAKGKHSGEIKLSQALRESRSKKTAKSVAAAAVEFVAGDEAPESPNTPQDTPAGESPPANQELAALKAKVHVDTLGERLLPAAEKLREGLGELAALLEKEDLTDLGNNWVWFAGLAIQLDRKSRTSFATTQRAQRPD